MKKDELPALRCGTLIVSGDDGKPSIVISGEFASSITFITKDCYTAASVESDEGYPGRISIFSTNHKHTLTLSSGDEAGGGLSFFDDDGNFTSVLGML